MLKFQTYKFMNLSNLMLGDSRKNYLGCCVLQHYPHVVYSHMLSNNLFASQEVIFH